MTSYYKLTSLKKIKVLFQFYIVCCYVKIAI